MILKRRKKLSVDKIEKKIVNNNSNKNFFMFVIGMFICGCAINLFYKPCQVVTSGSTGLAMLINEYIHIDLSLIVLVILSIMLVLSFCVFGISYGVKDILGTIFYPIFISATSLLCKVILFDNMSFLFMMIIGGTLMGIGYGLTRRSGYSLGGFDFLYDLIYSKFKISIRDANIICNLTIILLSSFVFGIDKCIYSSIALYISNTVANRIMLGISRNKSFYIVTRKYKEVRDYIVNNMKHTVTIINARGVYSDKKRKMLLCIIPTIEYVKVKEVIKEIDKSAFLLITDTYEVVGAK